MSILKLLHVTSHLSLDKMHTDLKFIVCISILTAIHYCLARLNNLPMKIHVYYFEEGQTALPSRILELELRCKMLGYKSSKLKFVFLFDLFLNVEYLCAKQNRCRIERPALEDSNRKLNHGYFHLRSKHIDLSFLWGKVPI